MRYAFVNLWYRSGYRLLVVERTGDKETAAAHEPARLVSGLGHR